MKRTNRILSAVLAIVITMGMIPFAQIPVSASGGAQGKMIVQGTDHLEGKQATNVYYGSYEGDPIRWRTLQNKNGELYLLSDRVLTERAYDPKNVIRDIPWSNCELRRWLNNEFYLSSFSRVERGEISTQKLKNIDSPGGDADGGPDTVDNIFVLSYSDLGNTKLFNKSNPSSADNSRVAYDLNGKLSSYWCRTPYDSTWGFVRIIVDTDGVVDGKSPVSYEGVRPAFYLSTENVLLTSAPQGGKWSGAVGADSLTKVTEYIGGHNYKLTLYDPQRSGFNVREEYFVITKGQSIRIKYTGALEGENEYVSAMLCDKATGEVLYYGHLAQSSREGYADINIPKELANGEYTLKVFSEQVNGNYETDYMSMPEEIDLTVTDSSNIITRAEATVTLPVKGMYISGDATVTSDKYTATVLQWYEGDEYGNFGNPRTYLSKFREDYTYYALVRFDAKGSYVFDEGGYGVVNNTYGETVAQSKKSVSARFKFTNLDSNIYEAEATACVPIGTYYPYYGESDVYCYSGNNYTASLLTWYEIDPVTGKERYMDREDYRPANEYKKGYRYRLTLEFVPKSGYKFADTAQFYINGRKAKRVAYNIPTNGTRCSVEYVCGIDSHCIKNLTITDIMTPVAGEQASYNYRIVEPDAFSYGYLAWNEYDKNGSLLKTYVSSDNTPFTFKHDHIYKAIVYLDPSEKNNCYFDDNVKVTMNGAPADESEPDFNYGLFIKDFGLIKDPSAPISEINIKLDAPILGSPINITASSETKGCSAYLGGWQVDKPLSEPGNTLLPLDSFNFSEDHSYIAKIGIMPDSGRQLANDAEIYVNGELADRVEVYEDGIICYKLVYPRNIVEISSLSCTITPPRVGECPSFIATVPDGASYTAEVFYWMNEDRNYPVMRNEEFEAGGKYFTDVVFTPKNGCVILKDAEYFINGEKAVTKTGNKGDIFIYRYFDRLPESSPTEINQLSCTVTPPKLGEHPSFTVEVPDGANYTAEFCVWYDSSISRNLNSEYVFKAGGVYSASIKFTPKDGYTISENAEYTVNGEKESVDSTYDGSVWVEHYFERLSGDKNEITQLSCTVTPPEVGKTWSDAVTVPEDANYTAEISGWWDADRSVYLTQDEAFNSGMLYNVEVVFTAKDGYVIPEDAECMINGKIASKYTTDDGEFGGCFYFDRLPGVPEGACLVTLTEPKVGEKPDFNPVCDNPDYTVESVNWYERVDDADRLMSEGDAFLESTVYTVEIILAPVNEAVPQNPRCFINGEEAFSFEANCYFIAYGPLAKVHEPKEGYTSVWTEGFEYCEGLPEGWTTEDRDGDGYNWGLYDIKPCHGDYCIASTSYADDTPLTPDNKLYLPEFTLKEGRKYLLTFNMIAQDSDYTGDRVGVYISTDGGSTYTALGDDYTSEANYREVEIDLSAYAGMNVSLALVHHNSHDKYYVILDCFELWEENSALKGDVNGDGIVNTVDVILTLRHIAGWNITIDQSSADYNGDGKIVTTDVILMLRKIAGWNV